MRNLLKNYKKKDVDVFIAYLNTLRKDEKQRWIKTVSTSQLADAFKKVAATGLSIDGETVVLTWRKAIVISYDYHAYQNKILLAYPETLFDFGLVYKNDGFKMWKESGKVFYTHKTANPFAPSADIIGAYGVIKNTKGEFIETLNMSDIEKMQKASKMGFIWKTWFDRMVLKSVIKRICSVHFKDIVKDIDSIDNEQNDPSRASVEFDVLKLIDEAKTESELRDIYFKYLEEVEDKKTFIQLVNEKKAEL